MEGLLYANQDTLLLDENVPIVNAASKIVYNDP